MMTVHEVSQISGVSIRTLHHYDNIGLLPATKVTDAGYRMYDDTALELAEQPDGGIPGVLGNFPLDAGKFLFGAHASCASFVWDS